MMRKICTLLLLSFVVLSASKASADLYALRMGDGSAFPGSGADASPVFVDHFTDGGTLLSTINMPTVLSGSNHPFTLPAASTSVGHLALSTNGQYLTLGGDDAIPGTVTVRQTTAGRVIGRITLSDGSIDTSTSLTDAYPGSVNNNNDMRSAVSTDGTKFWTSGTSFPSTTANGNSGIHYATLGATTSFRLSPVGTGLLNNTRVANIYNGQLYTSSASGSFVGISTVGTGVPEPTANDQYSITLYVGTSVSGSGTASPYDFWFKDANTVYVADDRASRDNTTLALLGGGIQKWTFDGSSWSLAYILPLPTNGDGVRGLDGRINANGDAVLFGTTGTPGAGTNSLNPDSIVTITDTGAASTYTTVAPSGSNKIYRGIVFVPGIAGDYNHNGTVDAADYVVWRKQNGSSGVSLDADGDGNGTVNDNDYTYWKARFGNISGSGSGLGGSTSVPEPTSAVLFCLGIAAMFGRRRRT